MWRCVNFLQRSGSCVVRTFACSHHKGNTVYRLLVVPRVQVLGCQGLTEQPPSLSAGRCSLPLGVKLAFPVRCLLLPCQACVAPWLVTFASFCAWSSCSCATPCATVTHACLRAGVCDFRRGAVPACLRMCVGSCLICTVFVVVNVLGLRPRISLTARREISLFFPLCSVRGPAVLRLLALAQCKGLPRAFSLPTSVGVTVVASALAAHF